MRADSYDATFGFYNGKSGVARDWGFLTSSDNQFGNIWLLSSTKRDMHRANGVDLTTQSSSHSHLSRMSINGGSYFGSSHSRFVIHIYFIFTILWYAHTNTQLYTHIIHTTEVIGHVVKSFWSIMNYHKRKYLAWRTI